MLGSASHELQCDTAVANHHHSARAFEAGCQARHAVCVPNGQHAALQRFQLSITLRLLWPLMCSLPRLQLLVACRSICCARCACCPLAARAKHTVRQLLGPRSGTEAQLVVRQAAAAAQQQRLHSRVGMQGSEVCSAADEQSMHLAPRQPDKQWRWHT